MHQYFHTVVGFCLWDLLALIVLLVMIVVLVVHIMRQKKRSDDFEDELENRKKRYAKTTGGKA